jgi:hypothetical protein
VGGLGHDVCFHTTLPESGSAAIHPSEMLGGHRRQQDMAESCMSAFEAIGRKIRQFPTHLRQLLGPTTVYPESGYLLAIRHLQLQGASGRSRVLGYWP